MGELWFEYVIICENVWMTMCVHVMFGDGDKLWMVYVWFDDKVIKWILAISCVDNMRINMFVDWIRMNVMMVI